MECVCLGFSPSLSLSAHWLAFTTPGRSGCLDTVWALGESPDSTGHGFLLSEPHMGGEGRVQRRSSKGASRVESGRLTEHQLAEVILPKDQCAERLFHWKAICPLAQSCRMLLGRNKSPYSSTGTSPVLGEGPLLSSDLVSPLDSGQGRAFCMQSCSSQKCLPK